MDRSAFTRRRFSVAHVCFAIAAFAAFVLTGAPVGGYFLRLFAVTLGFALVLRVARRPRSTAASGSTSTRGTGNRRSVRGG
jgi:hypothetical protein